MALVLPNTGDNDGLWGTKINAALTTVDGANTTTANSLVSHSGTGHPQHPVLTNGKLDASVLPALSVSNVSVVGSQAAMLAISGAKAGDIAIRTDVSNQPFMLTNTPATTLSNWITIAGGTSVQNVNGKGGTSVVLILADIIGALGANGTIMVADSAQSGKVRFDTAAAVVAAGAGVTNVNGKTGNTVTLTAADVSAADSSHTHPHTHVIADTTGLQAALDAKAPTANVPVSVRVRKSADQSLTSSTTLTNVTDMTFAIAASEEWDFEFSIFYDAATASDIQFALTAPSGAVLFTTSIFAYGTGVTGGSYNATMKQEPITALATGAPAGGNNAGFITPCTIKGTVLNSITAGNVNLQFAQNTSGATASIVKANSLLIAVKSS